MSSSKLPVWVALVGSGLAGALVAVQSRVNGGLGKELGNGYLGAVVSFGSGLVILCIVMLLSPRGRRGLALVRGEVQRGRLPIWALTGGACGAFFVLGQGLAASVLGVAMFTVGVVAGQVGSGLVIDRLGIGPAGRVDPTAVRIVGTVLAVCGVLVSVFTDLRGGTASWLVVIPVIAGIGVAWQSAVNGLVRSAAQSALAATFVNFVVGTAILLVIAGVSVGLHGWPSAWPAGIWWYSGGAVGAIFIGIAAALVRTAGVLLLSMSNVAGQLLASVALEAGLPLGSGVTFGLLAGAAISLGAVVIAAIPHRAARRAETTARV